MIEVASILGSVLKQAKELYDEVNANELDMLNLKVTLNGIIEGLFSYKNLSIEGNSRVIDSIQLAVKGAGEAVKQVRAS